MVSLWWDCCSVLFENTITNNNNTINTPTPKDPIPADGIAEQIGVFASAYGLHRPIGQQDSEPEHTVDQCREARIAPVRICCQRAPHRKNVVGLHGLQRQARWAHRLLNLVPRDSAFHRNALSLPV